MSIHTTPNILIVHLMRFQHSGFFEKIGDLIHFPIRTLDIREFVSRPSDLQAQLQNCLQQKVQ